MTKFEGIKAAFNAVMNNRRYNSDKNFSRRISNNTRVEYCNGVFSVVLHDTAVFQINLDTCKVTVNTGYWFTTTTRNAINDAATACRQNIQVSFAGNSLTVNGTQYSDARGSRLAKVFLPAWN